MLHLVNKKEIHPHLNFLHFYLINGITIGTLGKCLLERRDFPEILLCKACIFIIKCLTKIRSDGDNHIL
jgi:hypothetical protein